MSSAFDGLPKTPNLKLNKPGYDNVADIEALNENADILDEEIQGIKNTFVKSVNGINAGDDGNVDLGIIPISQGGTGQTTASGVRNALGLGNTTGAVPIANGGTGQTTAANALKAFVGSSALGSSSKPIYYTGSAFAACAASVGAANNGGIIAASLNTNGYVKFANGLILQWGATTTNSTSFPITFPSACFAVVCQWQANRFSRNDYLIISSAVSNSNFTWSSDLTPTKVFFLAIGK